ncbi:methyl-accepting chemotaxis protein [Oceanirhabdus sp. W0125-5]|uniref:methyl-accepting chemotaxis protein n=1 Tax=Oceanirhabdus sp. W0125-5 TaxID=2999116 RepID=UPI0022F30C80|nr:methyl-accepting chemotaxis protein [Oceanirhabdus sp. W0125-5]WBW99131.1 methyl-accepting chemotaxis protein [Oceanirhabdus sp. W0125-5]
MLKAKDDKKRIRIKKTKGRKKSRSIKIRLVIIPLVIVMLAIIGIGSATAYLGVTSLLNQMQHDSMNQIDQIIQRMNDNNQTLKNINRMLDNKLAVSGRMVLNNQEKLSNDYLSEIAQNLDVDEIFYYNSNGEIVYSATGKYIGWIPPVGNPVYGFWTGSKDEYFEDVRPDSKTGNSYKYGYVRNEDGSFVQVGIIANKIQALRDKFNYQALVENLGENEDIVYALVISKELKAIAHSNRDRIGIELTDEGSKTAAVDGKKYASTYTYEAENIEVFDVLAPLIIDGEHVGAINIGLSMKQVYDVIWKNVLIVGVSELIALVVLGVILFLSSNYAVKILVRLNKIVGLMASGDLSNEVPNDLLMKRDEFGEISSAIEDMRKSVKGMIQSVADKSQQVTASSQELSAISEQSATAANGVARTIEEISRGANEQAKATESGVADIGILSEQINKNQEDINNLNVTVDKVSELKNEGFEILNVLVENNKISSAATIQVNDIIMETNDSAEKIEKASLMIKNIADQTNLLALNAAIEAARAGESGKGFAVVADEVRKLAEESNNFTNEITEIIQGLLSKTQSAVSRTQEISNISEIQTANIKDTNTKFEGIANAIDTLKAIIDNLNVSGEEMRRKQEQIIDVMENLSAISEENATGTQEASASVEEQTASMNEIAEASEFLGVLAEEMQSGISRFKY